MNEDLAIEIKRLKKSFSILGFPFEKGPGATIEDIQATEEELGIRFDEYLRDMYLFSNGGWGKYEWFILRECLTCSFYSLGTAKNRIFTLLEMDARGELWSQIDEERDERIQPKIWHAKKWFPFSESGVGTYIHYDGWPTAKGKYGQIVIYQHDPDTVYYGAKNFLEFFRKSNDAMERYARGEMEDELFFGAPF